MIFVDMNQVTIGALMVESKGKPTFDENLVRHMIFNSIRSILQKNRNVYGSQLTICYDDSLTWRKLVYPNYKIGRRKKKADSTFEWDKFYALCDTIRTDLRENFPYRVLQVTGCEADDIIATLVESRRGILAKRDLIYSSDKDFVQLLNEDVHQYSPYHKERFLPGKNPEDDLLEHIIRGDATDSIPNALSDSDTFAVEGKRQKTLTQKTIQSMIDAWKSKKPNTDLSGMTSDSNILNNLRRNAQLIDFRNIPQNIRDSIMQEFDSTVPVDNKGKILDYFITKGMKHLIPHISEF